MNIFDTFWNFFIGLFGYVMEFCYSISFGNYALALLFYAFFFKLLLFPFSLKQQKTSIKSATLRPRIAAIEKKYEGKTDRASVSKKQQEIMELQQRNGISTMGGCLPLLIQMPIIIALFEIIRRPLSFISHLSNDVINRLGSAEFFNVNMNRQENPYCEIQILSKLFEGGNSAAAELVEGATLPQLSMWGIDFGQNPSFGNLSLTILVPFLVFAAQLASMLLMQLWSGMLRNSPKEARVTNWVMMLLMPLMTLFFAFNFPAAIGVYWIYQSLLGLLQSFILSRLMPVPHYTDEEIAELERIEKERRRQEVKTSNRGYSLHHIDDDDEFDESLVPVIQSKYDDDGDIAADNAVMRADPNSKTQQKKSNKSKKKK